MTSYECIFELIFPVTAFALVSSVWPWKQLSVTVLTCHEKKYYAVRVRWSMHIQLFIYFDTDC